VGQGGTPEAARRAAGASRPKEKAEVSYMHTSWPPPLADLMAKIVSIAPHGGIYLVGGALRDALLGRTSHDFDFVVAGDAIRFARKAAGALGADFYVLDEDFGAARVIVTGASGIRDFLDFATIRGGSIEADLAARDFTINALALNLRDGTTLDPLQGTGDLRAKLLRVCSRGALIEDPIRILRAVRLAAELDLGIESGTRQGMKATANLLPSISAERKRDELFRMLGGRKVDACMRALEMLGVFPHFLPELSSLKGVEQSAPHVHDAWEHTLRVMRHLEAILDLVLENSAQDANGLQTSLLTLGIGRYRQQMADHFSRSLNPDRSSRALLQFAALYHDVGKPATRGQGADGRIHFIGHEKEGATLAAQRAGQLNLSNAELEWIHTVIANHLRLFHLASRMEAEGEKPTRRAVYRFFRDSYPAGVELIILGLADVRGTRDHVLTEEAWSAWISVARTLLENLWESPQEAVAPPRLLDGNEIMKELAMQPGPAIGQLLEAIREAQAAGEVRDREGAVAFARDWISRSAEAPTS
jgi:putative nucleotidyltransferase with HDIG domain